MFKIVSYWPRLSDLVVARISRRSKLCHLPSVEGVPYSVPYLGILEIALKDDDIAESEMLIFQSILTGRHHLIPCYNFGQMALVGNTMAEHVALSLVRRQQESTLIARKYAAKGLCVSVDQPQPGCGRVLQFWSNERLSLVCT